MRRKLHHPGGMDHADDDDLFLGVIDDGDALVAAIRSRAPGDTVTVSGRTVAINGQVVGTAKTHAFDRRPLDPIAPTVIPPGHYYVQGTSADSFDSRYRASGLVRAEQVLGTVVPLF